MKTLTEISYEYAQLRGGGLPLTAEELCNCVVQWVQQYTKEQTTENGELLNKIRTATYVAITSQSPIRLNKRSSEVGGDNLIGMDISLDVQLLLQELMTLLKATDLIDYFEGSDTVVVDINKAGDKIEIHLDGEVIDKLSRAILQPVNAVSEDSVPVVSHNRDVTYKPLSEIGGGGTKLYSHRIDFRSSETDEEDRTSYLLITTYPNQLTPQTFNALVGNGLDDYVLIRAYAGSNQSQPVICFRHPPIGSGLFADVHYFSFMGVQTKARYLIDTIHTQEIIEL